MMLAQALDREELQGEVYNCGTDKLLRTGYEIVETPVRYTPRTIEEGKKIRTWNGLWALKVIIRDRFIPLSQAIDKEPGPRSEHSAGKSAEANSPAPKEKHL